MRANQYGVSGIPHVQFGGTLSSIGGGGNMYPTYLNRYNQLIDYNSPVAINLSTAVIGEQLVTQADMEVTGNISTVSNKVLFILTRHQDDDYFASVVGYDETSFNLNNTGDIGQFENSVILDPDWDIESLQSVVLVQSWNNDQIIQGSMMGISLDNMFALNCGFDGILSDNDGDGIINPGESVTVLLTINNESLFIEAENVVGTLSTETENVTIHQQDIQVEGSIDNQDGVWFEIDMDFEMAISLGVVPFTFSVTADYVDLYGNPGEFSRDYELTLDVSLFQKDWPHLTFNQIESSPAVLDIDGDGMTEVIYGEYGGLVHMVDEMGNEQPGFPVNLDNDIWGSPAVADMEGDGDIEIVIGSKDKHLLIINPDGSIQADYNAQQYIMATPALGDIDGDGELEAVFGGYSSPGKLFAVNADGSAVSGFPIALGEKIQRGVALADFNGNGLPDIVVGTDDEKIHVIYDDGTEAPGFPFEADNDFRTAPSVIDMNGEKVIVAGNRDDSFYGINSDGSLRFVVETGADVSTSAGFGQTPSGLGIFFGSDDGYVYGVDVNGNALSGWPQYLEDDVICSPVVVDLDGDGEIEIVTAIDGTELAAFHLDGSPVHHFPIHYGDFPFKGSPAVVDLDGDEDLEIMIGTARSIVTVDVKEASTSDGYWNIYRGNLHRTGYYEATLTGEVTVEVSHMADWNLVGLPVGLDNTEVMSVYPDGIEGTLFSFTDSYVQQDELMAGTGYWLRFEQAGTTGLTGTPITELTLSLQADWNLISGLSAGVNVSDISDPEGILIPNTFFGFGESYELADVLEPGKAYWLRTTGSGEVVLGGSSTSRVKEPPTLQANTINVKGMTLYFGIEVKDKLQYSLPPLPPEGVFDIRFSDDSRVCADDCEIEIRNAAGGMIIECRVTDGEEWELVDDGGNLISCSGDQQIPTDSESLILRKKSSELPLDYSMTPAYPNPFNPQTTIQFTLSEVTDMTVTIHDILGRQVTELVSGQMEPGHHSVSWNGTDQHSNPVSAGVYFLQINSADYTDFMKLILLK
jgi:hypothetical protein